MSKLTPLWVLGTIVLVNIVAVSSRDNGKVVPGYGIPRLEGLNVDSAGDSADLIRRLVVPDNVLNLIGRIMTDSEGSENTSSITPFQTIPIRAFHNVNNEQCKGQLIEMFTRILTWTLSAKKEDAWALQMIDAWGKIPEGILSGHVNSLGDFDECVDVVVNGLKQLEANPFNPGSNFVGKYCNIYLLPYSEEKLEQYYSNPPPTRPPPGDVDVTSDKQRGKAVSPDELFDLITKVYGVVMLPSFGSCFPNACPPDDIEQILFNVFYMHVYNPPPPKNNTLMWPTVNPEFCFTGEKPALDAASICVIVLLAILVLLAVAATGIDIFLNQKLEKPPRRSLPFQLLFTFSLYTNIPKWLSTRPTADDLGCLHGIRVLSMSWIVLAHTWFVILYIPHWNMVEVKTMQEDMAIMTILNATLAVDTFFVLSGLLVGYNVLKMLQKTKGKLNIVMFYVHRYLRLTPVYAVAIGVIATLLPYVGRGPYWYIIDRWGRFCREGWWSNLLYVNNFVKLDAMCQGEAWYLANDMQFYIVSPLLLLPIYHWEKLGLAFLSFCTLLSTIAPMLMVHFYDTSPTTLGTKLGTDWVDDWFKKVYIKPHARIQTYLVGIWAGYLLYKTRGKRVRIPLPVVYLFWTISTLSCVAILYGVRDWFDNEKFEEDISKASALSYAGLSRLGWAVSISWVIFACVKGYGWLINDFLSWKAFMPLGRLCYCAFLISLYLQLILQLGMKQPMMYTTYTMTNFFFAHMVMTFIFAFFFTLMVETPFMQLEKLLFEGGGRRPPPAAAAPGPKPEVQAAAEGESKPPVKGESQT